MPHYLPDIGQEITTLTIVYATDLCDFYPETTSGKVKVPKGTQGKVWDYHLGNEFRLALIVVEFPGQLIATLGPTAWEF